MFEKVNPSHPDKIAGAIGNETIIIYHNPTSTCRASEKLLQKIIESYNNKGITCTKIIPTKTNYHVQFENNDICKIVRATEKAIGIKWDIAYIEKNIDHKICETIIYPNAKSRLSNNIFFWSEGDLDNFDKERYNV